MKRPSWPIETNMAEQDRLYQAGGAVEATPVLEATATGSYLRISLKSLRDVHDASWQGDGRDRNPGDRARRRLEG